MFMYFRKMEVVWILKMISSYLVLMAVTVVARDTVVATRQAVVLRAGRQAPARLNKALSVFLGENCTSCNFAGLGPARGAGWE